MRISRMTRTPRGDLALVFGARGVVARPHALLTAIALAAFSVVRRLGGFRGGVEGIVVVSRVVTDRVEPSHWDTIVAGNGKTGPAVGELFVAFDGVGVGKWVKLEVVRDGQRRKI